MRVVVRGAQTEIFDFGVDLFLRVLVRPCHTRALLGPRRSGGRRRFDDKTEKTRYKLCFDHDKACNSPKRVSRTDRQTDRHRYTKTQTQTHS